MLNVLSVVFCHLAWLVIGMAVYRLWGDVAVLFLISIYCFVLAHSMRCLLKKEKEEIHRKESHE